MYVTQMGVHRFVPCPADNSEHDETSVYPGQNGMAEVAEQSSS